MTNVYHEIARGQVLIGAHIPAHDETFELAENIGKLLDKFYAYVSSSRSEEQAKKAVQELCNALSSGKVQPPSFLE